MSKIRRDISKEINKLSERSYHILNDNHSEEEKESLIEDIYSFNPRLYQMKYIRRVPWLNPAEQKEVAEYEKKVMDTIVILSSMYEEHKKIKVKSFTTKQ